MRKEANIVGDCMIAMSEAGGIAWRNNTGILKDKTGRPIKFGLCIGSSDIIAIAPDGVFTAVECKTEKGKATPAQLRFIGAVKSKDGRAGVARCGKDAVDIMLGRV